MQPLKHPLKNPEKAPPVLRAQLVHPPERLHMDGFQNRGLAFLHPIMLSAVQKTVIDNDQITGQFLRFTGFRGPQKKLFFHNSTIFGLVTHRLCHHRWFMTGTLSFGDATNTYL